MTNYIVSSGKVSGEVLNNAETMTVLDGGTATITTVNSSGYLRVSSGGTADSTTIAKKGSMFIFSGGVADNTILPGGYVEVFNGGVVNVVTLNNDYSILFVSSGGTANKITLKKGTVGVCGTATIRDWTPGEGHLDIYDGATVSFASKYNGVYFGSTHALRFDDQELGSDSWMYVMSGGIANNTQVPSYGCLYIFSNGTAFSTFVNSNSYGMYVFDKGVASDTYVMKGGSSFICCEALACNTVVNDGSMFVGGSAINTTVNSRGSMFVSSGGIADVITLASGGKMFVSGNGTITGRMTFESGAIVSAYEGAILDFDLTQVEADGAALMNDLSIIKGTPLYTLRVSKEQEKGKFVLADGATGFDGTISVQTRIKNNNKSLGTLTVGCSLETDYNNYRYSLDLTDGNLIVT